MTIYNLKIIYEAVSDYPATLIHAPSDIFEYMQDAFVKRPLQEAFYVLPLNRKNRVLGRYMVSLGTLTSTIVHPREVFQPIILASANAFVVCHNHPSGDPSPSRSDVKITRDLCAAGNLLDFEMLDHLIIGSVDADPLGLGYYSFNEAGLLSPAKSNQESVYEACPEPEC